MAMLIKSMLVVFLIMMVLGFPFVASNYGDAPSATCTNGYIAASSHGPMYGLLVKSFDFKLETLFYICYKSTNIGCKLHTRQSGEICAVRHLYICFSQVGWQWRFYSIVRQWYR